MRWYLRAIGYFMLAAMPLFGCGPSGQAARSAAPMGSAKTAGGTGNAAEGKSPATSVSASTADATAPKEPNVPFAMLGGGPRHLHRANVPGPREAPVEIARFRSGGRVAASPTIGPDGTIYVGSIDGTFNALSRNGPLRWSYICDAPIFSTAAISQTGKVFVGCDDDTLLAFSTDGAFRWSYKMKEDVDSAPVIAEDGIIYVGGEGLHALDGDGRRRFKVWLGGHVTASPAIRPDGVVVVGTHDHRLYMVEKNGTVVSSFETRGPIQGAAAAFDNNDVVFGSDDRYLYRVSPKGALRWKLETGGPIQSGVAVSWDEKQLFVTSMDGAVYAVDAASGKPIWKQETAGSIKSSPMLDNDGTVYVGSRDHFLYAFDAVTGEIRWRIDLKSEIDATVAVAAGHRLIVGSDDGMIRLLEAPK